MNSVLENAMKPVNDLLNSQADQITALNNLVTKTSLQMPMVFEDLECSPWLIAGGAAANSGSTGPVAGGDQAQPTQTCANFGLFPTGPFANKYFYKTLGAHSEVLRYRQEGSFMLPETLDTQRSQAIEFDLQQCISGVVFNMGWQFDFAQNQLRYWDRGHKTWVSTGQSFSRLTPGKWISCVFDMHRDAASIFYDRAFINGVAANIQPASMIAPKLGLSDSLNYGFQLDANQKGESYRVYVDRMRLTTWSSL